MILDVLIGTVLSRVARARAGVREALSQQLKSAKGTDKQLINPWGIAIGQQTSFLINSRMPRCPFMALRML